MQWRKVTGIERRLALNVLGASFSNNPNPKRDLTEMRVALDAGNATLYAIKKQSHDCYCVITTEGKTVFIWALTGNGLTHLAPDMIDRFKSRGMTQIRYGTSKKGMRRILSKFGFVPDGDAELIKEW